MVRYHGTLVVNTHDIEGFELISTSVYPNPFKHTTTLKVSGPLHTNSILNVYNSLGQIVHSQTLSSTETILQLGLAEGIYTYLISSERGALIGRGKLAIL